MVEREEPNDNEQVAAINDLIEGVKSRWEGKVACTILANALGACIAELEYKKTDTMRDYMRTHQIYADIARETMFDVVEKGGA